MSSPAKGFLIAIDALSVASLLVVGVFIIGIALVFRDFGGPPAAAEQAETLRLIIFGLSLCLVGISVPLRSKTRTLIAFAIVTVTAMFVVMLDGGQPDVAGAYLVLMLIGFPSYFLRKRLAHRL